MKARHIKRLRRKILRRREEERRTENVVKSIIGAVIVFGLLYELYSQEKEA